MWWSQRDNNYNPLHRLAADIDAVAIHGVLKKIRKWFLVHNLYQANNDNDPSAGDYNRTRRREGWLPIHTGYLGLFFNVTHTRTA